VVTWPCQRAADVSLRHSNEHDWGNDEKHPNVVLLAGTFLAFLTCEQAHAGPVLWSSANGGDNHYYEFVEVSDPFTGNNNSWQAAMAAADASVFNGLSGHLATIGSQAENAFLLSIVPNAITSSGSFEGAWIGGKAPEGWLDGPQVGQAFTYTNWGGVEPNNAGYAYMNVGAEFHGVAPGQWADDSGVQGVPDPNNDPVIGYFVEYEAPVASPEPSSAILLALGGAGMACCRSWRSWRRRQSIT
jgi:hypothetical protein